MATLSGKTRIFIELRVIRDFLQKVAQKFLCDTAYRFYHPASTYRVAGARLAKGEEAEFTLA